LHFRQAQLASANHLNQIANGDVCFGHFSLSSGSKQSAEPTYAGHFYISGLLTCREEQRRRPQNNPLIHYILCSIMLPTQHVGFTSGKDCRAG
jgi:hypothetical protein